MALEDLRGNNKYLLSLDPANPLELDSIFDAAGHLRGIKNALRNTFPAVDGVVEASHTELSMLAGVENLRHADLIEDGEFPLDRIPRIPLTHLLSTVLTELPEGAIPEVIRPSLYFRLTELADFSGPNTLVPNTWYGESSNMPAITLIRTGKLLIMAWAQVRREDEEDADVRDTWSMRLRHLTKDQTLDTLVTRQAEHAPAP